MTRDELVIYKRKWNANNKDRLKQYYLKAHYSLSLEEYQAQCEKQDNLCACCSKEVPILYVDHCHDSNTIRGFICHSCNAGIGLLGDNLEGLEKAIKYLKGFKL
jgi:hypothetical protein